jgi:hypothetical protein
VSSGASSGSFQVRRERFDFTGIGFPHRDDPACTPTWRPHDDNEPAVESSGRDESFLTIVAPIIDARLVHRGEYLDHTPEIELPLLERFLELGPVERNSNRIYCSYIYSEAQRLTGLALPFAEPFRHICSV